MQHDIIKLCADSLRTFSDKKYGIKLKAAHAHELVSIFFGYKSKNSMLADTTYPLSNLQQAKFIIFDPTPCNTGFANQRLKDFQYNYLNAFHLAECFRSTIRAEKWASEKIYLSFREVAIYIAEQHLYQRLKMLGINSSSIEWNIDGDISCWDNNLNGALLTADVTYYTNNGESYRYSKYAIHLPRIAANLGYGEPKVNETRYSGGASKINFSEIK